MTHEEQIKKSVNDKVDSFNKVEEITLEISRIVYYLAELNSKQWHIIKDAVPQGEKEEAQKPKRKARKRVSQQQEAVSDSKENNTDGL